LTLGQENIKQRNDFSWIHGSTSGHSRWYHYNRYQPGFHSTCSPQAGGLTLGRFIVSWNALVLLAVEQKHKVG